MRQQLTLSSIALLLMCSVPKAWAETPEVSITGRLPRGAESSALVLDVTINRIVKADIVGEDAKKTLLSRLKFNLKDNADTNRIKFADETTTDPVAVGFELTVSTAPVLTKIEGDPSERQKLVVSLILRATDNPFGELIKTKENKRYVRIGAKYTTQANEAKDDEFQILQQTGVVDAAPEVFVATRQHRGIAISWNAPGSLKYTDSSSAPPTGTVVFVIDVAKHLALPQEGRVLPATVFNQDLSQERATQCQLTLAQAEGTCTISCPDANSYLVTSVADLSARTDIRLIKLAVGTNSTAVTQLEPEQLYATFAQFDPDGVQRSACKLITAKTNRSLTELNGAKDAKPGNPNCFIATAAYGSPIAPQLDTLRSFRDRILLKSPIGRQFVRLYYSYSPPLAAKVAEHEYLRAGVRGLLWLPLTILEAIDSE